MNPRPTKQSNVIELDGQRYVLILESKWDALETSIGKALEEELERREMVVVKEKEIVALEKGQDSFWVWFLTRFTVGILIFDIVAGLALYNGWQATNPLSSKFQWTPGLICIAICAGLFIWSAIGGLIVWPLRAGFHTTRGILYWIFDMPMVVFALVFLEMQYYLITRWLGPESIRIGQELMRIIGLS